jgi:uncharacterized protein YndB with AHSA1/START domain
MTDGFEPVRASKRIAAPPSRVFAILADPTKHTELDGSGMLRGAVTTRTVSGVGDVFTMRMFFSELGDYEMHNHVVEFEPDRLIAWEPEAGRGHPDAGPPGLPENRWGHRWIFELAPDGPDATIVTEIYDCSRVPLEERETMDNGRVWMEGMTATLHNLQALCELQAAPPVRTEKPSD